MVDTQAFLARVRNVVDRQALLKWAEGRDLFLITRDDYHVDATGHHFWLTTDLVHVRRKVDYEPGTVVHTPAGHDLTAYEHDGQTIYVESYRMPLADYRAMLEGQA